MTSPKATLRGEVRYEVSLREIAAVFDVTPAHLLVAGREGAELLVDAIFEGFAGTAPGRPRRAPVWVDAEGEQRHGARPVAGVRWGVQPRSGLHVWRTFDRTASRPISGRYVYVFQGTAPDGRDSELHRVLHFEGGKIAECDKDAALSGGMKTPLPRDHADRTLLLTKEIVRNHERRAAVYHLLLAPYPLPPARIGGLARSTALALRAVRLFDEAFTDWYTNGDVASAVPTIRRPPPEDGRASYLVHLPDVLGEAVRRHAAFEAALDALEREQRERAGDRRYTLAKRIELATAGAPALRATVASKLSAYTSAKERRGPRLHWLVHVAANDLTRWLGQERRTAAWLGPRGQSIRVGVHHFAPKDGTGEVAVRALRRTEPDGESGSPFSEAIRDHLDGDPRLRDEILEIAAQVQARLAESPHGERWLEENLGRALSGGDGLADAGADYFFQMGRKASGSVPEALGRFLEVYAEAWIRRYREQALRGVDEWMQARYGITLKRIAPRAARREAASRARRELRRARKRPIDSLALDPSAITGVRLTERASSVLMLGIEVLNAKYAVQRALDDPRDPWKWVEALGSAMDAYEALSRVSAKVPARELELYKVGRVAVKATPVAIVAGALDVVTGVRDTASSELVGQAVGNGIKTTGAIVTLGCVLAPVTGAVLVAAVAGLVVQALGNWMVGHFSPLATFLRNCEFGEGSALDAAVSRVKRDAADWCPNGLAELATSVDAQHDALDKLLHRFEPRVEVRSGRVRLSIRMDNPSQLSEASFFDAQITVSVVGRGTSTTTLKAGASFDDEPLLRGDWADLPIAVPAPIAVPYRTVPQSVGVSGWVELDVYGDGRLCVRRTIDAGLHPS